MSKVEASAPAERRMFVSVAYLQAPATIPGVFTSETTLGGPKTAGCQLELVPLGILITKGSIRAIVPMTNVKVAVLK